MRDRMFIVLAKDNCYIMECLEQQATKGHLIQLVALSNLLVDVYRLIHNLRRSRLRVIITILAFSYKVCVAVAFEASPDLGRTCSKTCGNIERPQF